ncbi:MAG: CPBP family intramembrane metalloprotease [Ignavibacteriales bacterium]|nr:MAG: CPBP family intramembrane metalloprotease [Ignavibacteriales bacterium]
MKEDKENKEGQSPDQPGHTPGEKDDSNQEQGFRQDDDRIAEEPLLKPTISPVKAGFIGLMSGFFIYQIFSSVLTVVIFGANLDQADPNALRLMQTAGQILFMLLPALILSKMIYDNVTELLRIRMPDFKGMGLFILAMLMLIIAMQNFLLIQGHFAEVFFQNNQQFAFVKEALDSLNKMIEGSYKVFFRMEGFLDYLIIILVVAVVPSIAEELMFRGYIQRSFELRYKPFWAAVITAFFFSIFHVNPAGVIGLFAIGLFLGFAAYKTDSMLTPVVLHFLNNFISVLFVFIYGESELIQPAGILSPEMLTSAQKNFFYTGALFLASVFAIQFYYKKHAKKQYANE